MREGPILFSGPMVRAILDGRKTKTRRVVKPQPDEDGLVRDLERGWLDTSERSYRCPYGVAGDRLWVREAFAIEMAQYLGGDSEGWHTVVPTDDDPFLQRAVYRATGPTPTLACSHARCDGAEPCQRPWHPSIHMPRWASRITLEIEEVRVERVQSISEEDALAEGCEPMPMVRIGGANPGTFTSARESFRSLWDSINAKRGFDWAANPFVWCITFRPLEVRG